MTTTQTQSIVVDFDLPHPPAKVWRALTQADLVEKWLMQNDLRPVVGHHFQFHDQPVEDWDGIVDCDVLVVDPERTLSYTWRGGSAAQRASGTDLDTTVTWTLTPTASGTHVRLEHAGFTSQNAYVYEILNSGWRSKVVTSLARVVDEMA